jgi:beta-lactamase class D
MSYKVLGMDWSDGNVESVELHEADTSEEANGWVVGYVRHDNMGGYDAINVVAANGYTKSEFTKDFGWNHY